VWSRTFFGDSTWGVAGATWGSTATLDHVSDVRRIVSEWKPAGTRCRYVILAYDDASFDPSVATPDGQWGRYLEPDSDPTTSSRLQTALYWNGVPA